jgi:hypothetical protein
VDGVKSGPRLSAGFVLFVWILFFVRGAPIEGEARGSRVHVPGVRGSGQKGEGGILGESSGERDESHRLSLQKGVTERVQKWGVIPYKWVYWDGVIPYKWVTGIAEHGCGVQGGG